LNKNRWLEEKKNGIFKRMRSTIEWGTNRGGARKKKMGSSGGVGGGNGYSLRERSLRTLRKTLAVNLGVQGDGGTFEIKGRGTTKKKDVQQILTMEIQWNSGRNRTFH